MNFYQKFLSWKLLPIITFARTAKSKIINSDAKIASLDHHYAIPVAYNVTTSFPSTKSKSGMGTAIFPLISMI
jgi:hypothetical protein